MDTDGVTGGGIWGPLLVATNDCSQGRPPWPSRPAPGRVRLTSGQVWQVGGKGHKNAGETGPRSTPPSSVREPGGSAKEGGLANNH